MERFVQYIIYGHPELILFLIAIVTGHQSSWKNGNGTASFPRSREEVTQR